MAQATLKNNNSPSFTALTDLAAERLGGKVIYATDDFFAEKENLIKPGRGVFIADKYTDRGKWMDGWESRRKRTSGHDWAIIRLAVPGFIRGFDIDTNHFLGNHPPFASIEAIRFDEEPLVYDLKEKEYNWEEILPKSPLERGSQNFYAVNSQEAWTHIKLHIYPDGGVARLRIYGDVWKDWDAVAEGDLIDLASAVYGGKAIACNDMFFSAMGNLIMPGRGVNMGDGWETKRNRTPNNRDWVILKLAHPGIIKRVLADTCHFKGNYPDTCSIEACYAASENEVTNDKVDWKPLLPKVKLSADHEHYFVEEIKETGKVNYVRLNIFPDGGVSRLRLFGHIVKGS